MTNHPDTADATADIQPVLWLETLPRKLYMIPHLRTLAYHENFKLISEVRCQSLQFCFRRAGHSSDHLTVSIDGDIHQVGFPHLMIKRPGQTIRFLDATSTDALYFSYSLDNLAFFENRGLPSDFSIAPLDFPPEFLQILEAIDRWSQRLGEPGMADRLDLACYALVHQSFLQLVQNRTPLTPYDKKIQQIASYLQNHFMDRIDLEDLARKHGFSYRNLLRQWSRIFGQTPTAYLNHLKLLEAKRLLRETNLTIHEIAQRMGCCDDGYFCRFFKRHEKVTPKEFRNS